MYAFSRGSWRRKGIATAALVLALSFAVMAPRVIAFGGGPSPTDTNTTYGGRAYGAGASVPFVGEATYADTGDLPAEGGALFGDSTPVDDPAISATTFLTYTRGFLDGASAAAAMSDVALLAGSPFEVDAGFVYAGASAACDGASATSEIFDLTVGGVPVLVTGEPNEVYWIPGILTLVINEQTDGSNGATYDMTANALHLILVDGLEVVVASARSAVTCGAAGGALLPPDIGLAAPGYAPGRGISPMWGGGPIPKDFVTGGGFFEPPNSNQPGRVNFGFNAGPRPGTYPDIKGHLNLVDHGSGDHIQGVNVDTYSVWDVDPDHCRQFTGDATVNGAPGYRFIASVCDYGEPGRNDRFAIEVHLGSDDGDLVYAADNARTFCPPDQPACGELDGGNIQLHVFRK